MQISSPSYRNSNSVSSENENDITNSDKQFTGPPKPRFSFLKFNISDGIPLKRNMMATRETIEDLLERESTISYYRPQTSDSQFFRNNTTQLNSTRSNKEPHFCKFNQKKRTLADYEIYNALRTEKKRVQEGEAELPGLADTMNRASVISNNVRNASFNYNENKSPLFAKTPAKTSANLKTITTSPRNLQLRTPSVTSTPNENRIFLSQQTPTPRKDQSYGIKPQYKINKNKAIVLSASQANETMDVKMLIQITNSALKTETPRKNEKTTAEKKKKAARREENEELTIDKIGETHFNRFKTQLSLYNRYYTDYIYQPKISFKSFNDLHIDLTRSAPQVVRKNEVVPVDPTSIDALRKAKQLSNPGKAVQHEKKPLFESNSKKSAVMEGLEANYDIVANSKLASAHSKHIKTVDDEKYDLNTGFYQMNDAKLNIRQLKFLEEVKAGNVAEVSLELEYNPELTKIRDGVRETPLHWACKRGNLAMVEVLLENGADFQAIDIVGRTPRVLAQNGGFIEIVKILNGYHEDFVHRAKLRENLLAGSAKKSSLFLENAAS